MISWKNVSQEKKEENKKKKITMNNSYRVIPTMKNEECKLIFPTNAQRTQPQDSRGQTLEPSNP